MGKTYDSNRWTFKTLPPPKGPVSADSFAYADQFLLSFFFSLGYAFDCTLLSHLVCLSSTRPKGRNCLGKVTVRMTYHLQLPTVIVPPSEPEKITLVPEI